MYTSRGEMCREAWRDCIAECFGAVFFNVAGC